MLKSNHLEGGAKIANPPWERIVGVVLGAFNALGAALIVLVLAATALSVFQRYVLGKPLSGVDEATGFLVVAIVMAGAGSALRSGDHIRIDILIDAMGSQMRRWFDVLAYASVLLFSLLLTYTAWHSVTFSYAFEVYSAGYLELPLWIPQSAMVVGGALLTLAAVERIVVTLTRTGL